MLKFWKSVGCATKHFLEEVLKTIKNVCSRNPARSQDEVMGAGFNEDLTKI